MADKIGIHWFRLDLRLNDNPSLIYLNKEVDKIIPIFIYDENTELGQASKCWLEKSLEILHNELCKNLIVNFIFSKGIQKKLLIKLFWKTIYPVLVGTDCMTSILLKGTKISNHL